MRGAVGVPRCLATRRAGVESARAPCRTSPHPPPRHRPRPGRSSAVTTSWRSSRAPARQRPAAASSSAPRGRRQVAPGPRGVRRCRARRRPRRVGAGDAQRGRGAARRVRRPAPRRRPRRRHARAHAPQRRRAPGPRPRPARRAGRRRRPAGGPGLGRARAAPRRPARRVRRRDRPRRRAVPGRGRVAWKDAGAGGWSSSR